MTIKKIEKEAEKAYRHRKLEFIKLAILQYYGGNANDFTRLSKSPRQVKIRQVLCYLAIKDDYSQSEIAREIKRSPSTASHGHDTIEGYMRWDTKLRAEIDHLWGLIENRAKLIKVDIEKSKEYYFVDLSNNVSFKIGKDKAIVLAGFTGDEIRAFVKANNLGHIESVESNNSEMYIVVKNKK